MNTHSITIYKTIHPSNEKISRNSRSIETNFHDTKERGMYYNLNLSML